MKQVPVSLMIQSHHCNGSMSLKLFNDDRNLLDLTSLESGHHKLDFMIDWPSKIRIFVEGKNQNDTEVDSGGNVIADKAIELISIMINNFPLHPDLIDKLCCCRRSNQQSISHENYWGFNGLVEIIFDHANPLRFMLALSSKFEIPRLENQ